MPAIPNSAVHALFDGFVRPNYRNGHRTFALNLAALSVLVALTAAPAHAQSYDWAPMALVSDTMGIQANRLCVGEPTRRDIGCPDYAPSVTTAGLEVSGTVSATRFVGDGSGLTGIAANVSVTTGASGSLVFRDGYGSLMASSGLSISSTTGSVGIGSGAPTSVGSYGLYVSNSIYAGLNIGVINGAVLGVSNGVALVRSSGSAATDLSFSPGSNQPEVVRIVSSGYVGIGTANPSSTLHVAGNIYGNNIWLKRPADGVYIQSVGTNTTNSQTLFIRGMNTAIVPGAPAIALMNTNSNALLTLFSSTTNPALAFVGIGISDTQPSATLHVSGSLWAGAISATALMVDGVTVTGGAVTFASLTDVSYSAAGSNVFGPGSLTGANAGVTESTAFGYNSLKSASNIGYANSAFGASALQSNTTGAFNTAFGRTALRGTSTGNYNTAVGASSLLSNTTGASNAAFGTNTLLNANGSNNAAFGSSAGQSFLSGNNNLMLGFNAGGGITSGNSNTIIGASISPYSNTGSNQLAIANAIWGDTGNGSALQAKIGINITSPTTNFAVSGTTNLNGFVGIAASSPKTNLDVAGSMRVGGEGSYIGFNTYYDNTSATWRNSWSGQQSAFIRLGQGSTYSGGDIQFGTTVGAALPGTTDSAIGSPSVQMAIRNLGDVRIASWTAIGFSNVTTTPTAPLTVSGTVSATRFVGDGSGLTGITAAANDNIASGTAYVKAVQGVGASVSGSLAVAGLVSASGDIKGNTLQLANAPPDACSAANAGALKRVGKRFYFCRP